MLHKLPRRTEFWYGFQYALRIKNEEQYSVDFFKFDSQKLYLNLRRQLAV